MYQTGKLLIKKNSINILNIIILILLLLLMPLFIQAQNFSNLDKSPMDQAKYPTSNRITKKVAIITYSRPQLKGRSFNDIVPQNKVWRTGANEATQVRFFSDVEINQTIIPAGDYTIFTIIDKEEITFIINTATNIWGAYSYKSDNDALRFKVPINKVKKSLEALSIAFNEEKGLPSIHFGWENVRFKIPFKVL